MFSKDVSPGPKYYVDPKMTRGGPEGNPKYSMLGRQVDPNLFKSPGPGAYNNHQVFPQGERKAPVYSMAGRSRYRKSDSNPAANAYTLPHLIGPKLVNKRANPSYSMTRRTNINGFAEDLAKTPGPANYNTTNANVVKTRQPKYSMLGRNSLPGDATRKPGPGAHSPERVYVNKRRAPAVSMGIRHSEFITPLIIDVVD